MARCSLCGTIFNLEQTPAPPFCSARCKEIDLGRWLDERYGLAIESEEDPVDEERDRAAPPQDDRA
jgi:uncharacterized protein